MGNYRLNVFVSAQHICAYAAAASEQVRTHDGVLAFVCIMTLIVVGRSSQRTSSLQPIMY
jgi:hypothetical protein